MKTFDVTALGEILIDFTFSGYNEDGMALFAQNPGGAPANVLAAVQKLGGKTAFIGKVGNDMHGNFLRNVLQSKNICCDGLLTDDNAFTTLAFVSLNENGERSFSFARKPGADTRLEENEVNYDIIKSSKVLHVGSLSLTDSPSREATLAALDFAKANNITVSYDPNYRAMLWKDEETAKKGMRSVLPYVDIIKISDEETELLTDEKDVKGAAKRLLGLGIKCVIVTKGSEGAYILSQKGEAEIKSKKVTVADTTGAGDSFMGGFLYKLTDANIMPSEISCEELRKFGDFAANVAAFCVSKRGALNAMPSLEDLG